MFVMVRAYAACEYQLKGGVLKGADSEPHRIADTDTGLLHVSGGYHHLVRCS